MTDKTTIDWRRLLTEGAVIAFSILLALWADAWWENHIEREDEQELLRALYLEFSANEKHVVESLDLLMEASRGSKAVSQMTGAELQSAMSDEILSWIRQPFTAELQAGAIEATLGTERGGLIQSSELLLALSQYQARRADHDTIEFSLEQLSREAYVELGMLPESHKRLSAICAAKSGLWEAYHVYLTLLLEDIRSILDLLEKEMLSNQVSTPRSQ